MKKIIKDVPNALTLFRIALIPVLVFAFYFDGLLAHWVTAIIFIFASITDYIDGLIARRYDAHSNFGRMFDPIADKLLVGSTLMMLVHFDRAPVIPCILILCREITVSGLREYLAEFKVSIPVSGLAKGKTAIQMVAIIILLLGEKALPIPHLDNLGIAALWFAAGLTLFTGYAYLKEGLKVG
ncbi:MAG: CDP-diacylglycerol--glycerol-3-phosphate 3-phosphatidyltransferase [Rickettsiales bacterium]